jgi:hypothetical protein
MVGTVLEPSWIRDQVNPQKSSAAIWGFYAGLLVVGCAAVAALLSHPRVRERLVRLVRSNTAFSAALMLVLAWSVFVFLWEPTGYYWSVNLFPLAFLASWWVRGVGKRTAGLLAGVLLAVSCWNVYGNHRQDQVNSVSYPPPMLDQIRAQLGPEDVFIVAGRDWYANLDYSLLLECLDDWPRDPALALLDEYIMVRSGEPWQQKLDHDIQAAFAAGGRVYVADHVFWPDSYRDLQQATDPFAEYVHTEYAGLDGDRLLREINSFFGRYQRRPSGFEIGTQKFWELKPLESP